MENKAQTKKTTAKKAQGNRTARAVVKIDDTLKADIDAVRSSMSRALPRVEFSDADVIRHGMAIAASACTPVDGPMKIDSSVVHEVTGSAA